MLVTININSQVILMALYPLKLEGAPRDLGLQRGSALRDLIRALVEDYIPRIRESEEHMKIRDHIEEALMKNFPEFLEELEGIAEGSGVACNDLLLLIAWWSYPTGCSNVALTETVIGPVLGSTLDVGLDPYRVMLFYKPKDGYSFVTVSRVDNLSAARAMNEEGLCIGGSSTKAIDKCMGFPRYVTLRAVAQYCATVDEALKLLSKYKEGFRNPFNVILVDSEGDAAVVEFSNCEMEVRKPENGGIACTNHYETRLAELEARGMAQVFESKTRYARLLDFIRKCNREKPIEEMMKILRSHGPGGICQHGPPQALHATLAFIMVPRKRWFYVSQPPGPYCLAKFIRYEPFK